MSDRPTKRAWLTAWLDGLERSRFTGEARLTLTLEHGSLVRLLVAERKPGENRRPIC